MAQKVRFSHRVTVCDIKRRVRSVARDVREKRLVLVLGGEVHSLLKEDVCAVSFEALRNAVHLDRTASPTKRTARGSEQAVSQPKPEGAIPDQSISMH